MTTEPGQGTVSVSDMQAIPTTYHNVVFRSRLEARWAWFFDRLKIKWQFEPMGFRLPSIGYLPDFYLTDVGVWVEIKPTRPLPVETLKATELANATGKLVYIFAGCPGSDAYLFRPKASTHEYPHRIVMCPLCKTLAIVNATHYSLPPCGCKGRVPKSWDERNPIRRAAEAALRVRFDGPAQPQASQR